MNCLSALVSLPTSAGNERYFILFFKQTQTDHIISKTTKIKKLLANPDTLKQQKKTVNRLSKLLRKIYTQM